MSAKAECQHLAIRRKRSEPHAYLENVYVCGNCAKLFVVRDYEPVKATTKEPMGQENKVPWGLRPRQA